MLALNRICVEAISGSYYDVHKSSTQVKCAAVSGSPGGCVLINLSAQLRSCLRITGCVTLFTFTTAPESYLMTNVFEIEPLIPLSNVFFM